MTNTSFAGIVANGGAGGHGQGANGGGGAGFTGGLGQGLGKNSSRDRKRSVSPSVKRPRIEDGDGTVTEGKDTTRLSARPKPVVGTSDSIKTGRKMRSPPADIFIWGVHPDTTIEDIVNDLASSDITIKESDVMKKSNKDAYLCSYKIGVPANDLQKALDPAIWPLRVKVREFIHYAKKTPRQQTGSNAGDQAHAAGNGAQGVGGAGHTPHSQAQGGARQRTDTHLQVPPITLNNMFEALAATKGL